MNRDRWTQIETIFEKALALPPDQRGHFLDRACGSDATLRAEVDALLRLHGREDGLASLVKSAPSRTLTGQTIGNYQVMELVGRGGMGAVYRAVDLKLRRDVAIKVLPDEFSHDEDRVLWFQREAQALAAVNHPNIAAIHDIHELQTIRFLVLEYVDGETLAARVRREPVSLNEAVKMVMQVASALEAAHDRGIVHRDLKPANIKLTPGGDIKVLDFGLARVRERQPVGMDPSDQPTAAIPSSPGMIVGTPAYMAPEQAKGEAADRASDVWAFGCVFFELLTGKPPFRGETTAETLAEVLKAEPDWESLPAETPAAFRGILRRCLQKDVRSRFHDIADVRIAIEDAAGPPAPFRPAQSSRWREFAAWGVALLGIATAGLLLVRQPPSSPERRVDIVTPTEADVGGIALSPDGAKIAYTALNNGVPYLYVRSLDNGSVRQLPATDGAALPFWSPNSGSLGFFAESKLKRIDLDTNVIQPLAAATLSPGGGSWSKDGTIVFAPNIRGGIFQVQHTGGDARRVNPDGRSPRFLKDGRHYLFLDEKGVNAGSLDDPEVKLLSDAVRIALPGPPGYLMFLKKTGGARLFIQGFDERRLAFTGTETVLAGGVHSSTDGNSASVTASEDGIIAFREVLTADVQPRRLSEFDRSGKEIRKVGEFGGLSPSISPEGDYVVINRATNGNSVWLLETARGILTPFTAGPADQTAVWSPDGRNIVFSSARRDIVEMFIKPADGREKEQPLIDPPNSKNPRVATDWAGDFLLFRENSNETRFDIYALPMRRNDRQPIPIVRTEHSERDAQFSPDTKWIAYESNKSNRSEIFMTRFPPAGREFPISTNGGAQVRWNPRNKNELFYVALDGKLMSIKLQFSPDDTTVTALEPVALFQTRIGTVVQGAQKQQYVVSGNGQRFLVSNVIEDALSPITLIFNWKPPAN